MTFIHRFRTVTLLSLGLNAAAVAGETAQGQNLQYPSSHDGAGWFEPPVHSCLSDGGTPMVHSFGLEPAFIHRGLFLDYGFRKGADETEHEIEAELEWALTNRIGLVLEVPYAIVEPDTGASVRGFGDMAISPRFLLKKTERYMLAMNLEVAIPTGDEDKGLGSGEFALAPSFSAWFDLGGWTTLNAQVGVERGLESGETELMVKTSLIHTFGKDVHAPVKHGDHYHIPNGLLSVILEVDATVGLSDAERGDISAEGIIGLNYDITQELGVHAGYQFPITSPREMDGGFIIGTNWHF